MSTESNKDLIRRAFALINRGDHDAVGECVAADLVRNGQATGREGDRLRDEALAAAFPDLQYTMEDIVTEGDRAAVRWRMTGTHSGDLVGPSMSLPASGRHLDVWGISLYRLQNGLVQEIWESFDMMAFMEQLGALDHSDRPAQVTD
ncbi:MAG: ester cyclase [Actinomycetota bacterium]|nr:ester cyclase [Actinomycetota bacterium]